MEEEGTRPKWFCEATVNSDTETRQRHYRKSKPTNLRNIDAIAGREGFPRVRRILGSGGLTPYPNRGDGVTGDTQVNLPRVPL